MWDQEKDHLKSFSKLIVDRRVRPTALLPIWNIAGYALGMYNNSHTIYEVYVCVYACILKLCAYCVCMTAMKHILM